MRDIQIAFSDQFLFARQADQVLGVMGVVPQPGGTGLVFPPEIETMTDPEDVERQLIEASLVRLRRAGSAFAQLVLPPSEQPRSTVFEACGFTHLTDGLMLRRDARTSDQKPDNRLTTREYDPAVHQAPLISLITAINRGSLDCPELDAWRTPRQLFEGHVAATQPRPSRWTVYTEQGREVGLSITTASEDEGIWELLFFGVVPEFRGHGLGRTILDLLTSKTPILHAACDARNHFAKAIYADCGFTETGRAGIWIHSLGKPR